jgi:hypothetical protein
MDKDELCKKLSGKGVDVEALAQRVVASPESTPLYLSILAEDKGTTRYAAEKVLRRVSELHPELIYPYFDHYVALLDNENSFIKWGAILTIANLVDVDKEDRFSELFGKYYAPITGPVMITAGNIIRGSERIVASRPELMERVVDEVLKVEDAHYEKDGKPSPECRNIACGHAIDFFDVVYEQLTDKHRVEDFVRRQLSNTRKAVAKKAERYLQRHGV